MAALASDWLRHFRFFFWKRWMEFNGTWQKARSHRRLPCLCFFFRADRKTKMAALAFDLQRHFQFLLWNCWREFSETWQEAGSQHPLPSLCFFGPIGRWHPCTWFANTFSNSSLKPLKRIQLYLTGRKISTRSNQFLFFGPNGKTKIATPTSDLLRYFRLLCKRWIKFNETWKQASTWFSTSSTKFVFFVSMWFIPKGSQVHNCDLCGPAGRSTRYKQAW